MVQHPDEDRLVIKTCWVCSEESPIGTPVGEWVPDQEGRGEYLLGDDVGFIHIAIDPKGEDNGVIDIRGLLDSISANGESIHPVPTYLRQNDGLDPSDYTLRSKI